MDLAGDYYWDFTLGIDTNPGTRAQPFQNASVFNNATSIAPGTRINLKRGEVWRQDWTCPDSGLAGNRITVRSYDSGALPIINGADDVTAEIWNNFAGNVWWCTLTDVVYLVAFDDVLGTRVANTGAIDAAGKWWWDTATDRLYVFSVGNPSGAGVTIEAGQRGCFNVNDQDYIAIDGVECRHGQLADEGNNLSIGGGFHFSQGGSTGCILDNCLATRCHGFGFNFLNVQGLTATDCLAVDVVSNGETTHGDGFHVGSRWADHNPSTNVVLDGCDVQGTIARQSCSVTCGTKIEFVRGYITASAINSVDIEPNLGETVIGVIIHQMLVAPATGKGIKLSNGKGELTGGVVKHNLVIDVEEAVFGVGIVVSQTQDAKVFGNVTIGWDYPIRNSNNGVASIVNNTLVKTRRHAIRTILGGTTTAKNNVVYVASDAISPTCIHDATGNGTYENNLYFADDGTIYFNDGVWRLSLAAWQAQGYDLLSTQQDPLFEDVATDKYWPTTSSPLVDNGETQVDTFQMGLDPDTAWPDGVVLANHNDEGTGWEIGAYILEFDSSSSPTSPAVDVCPAGKSMSVVGPAGSTLAIPV